MGTDASGEGFLRAGCVRTLGWRQEGRTVLGWHEFLTIKSPQSDSVFPNGRTTGAGVFGRPMWESREAVPQLLGICKSA